MDRQPIYVVSGGSGETALRTVQAALTQFSKGEASALVRRFQNVRTREDLDRVLETAADKRAVIVHTTVSRELRRPCRSLIGAPNARRWVMYCAA